MCQLILYQHIPVKLLNIREKESFGQIGKKDPIINMGKKIQDGFRHLHSNT